MTPITTNTQNLSYISHKHPNLSSLTPTELHFLHSDPIKYHPHVTFSTKLFTENTLGRDKSTYEDPLTPKRSLLTSE